MYTTTVIYPNKVFKRYCNVRMWLHFCLKGVATLISSSNCNMIWVHDMSDLPGMVATSEMCWVVYHNHSNIRYFQIHTKYQQIL